MRIAASLLDPDADVGKLTSEAGVAYGLAGIIRAISFHAARGKTFLPRDLLIAEELSSGDALSVRHSCGVQNVVSRLARAANEHFERTRRIPIPKHVLPAILPAALVPAYLRDVTRDGRQPLRDRSDVSLFRRQLILLRAATLGRF
jgi:phytoene synthase